jgi:glycosyltransferase involved in cell wall biosynthesis
LQRCINSILSQKISFQHEIIISDDRSTDGTWELALDYANNYPNLIFCSSVNSDECNPDNTSHRTGWNRCKVYKLAHGNYITHIDADDYLIGADIYQRQVEMLEKHPKCSLCMQNVWVLNEGTDFETGHTWFPAHKFTRGRIISAQEFIKEDYFIINQAFVMRRNPDVDPVALYGKRYVDSVITYHHLQFGDIVCVDKCDFVYTKHSQAITSSLPDNDKKVLWCLAVYIPLLIPRFTGLFYAAHLKDLLHLINHVRRGMRISKASANSILNMGAYIYDLFSRPNLTAMDRIRLNMIRFYIILLMKLDIKSRLALRILHFLMIGQGITRNASFSIH